MATTVSAGIRAYSVLPTLNSCYFPRLGIGVSAGVTRDFDFAPLRPYASVYGYLPGLWKSSGLGLSASYSTEAFENNIVSKRIEIIFKTLHGFKVTHVHIDTEN